MAPSTPPPPIKEELAAFTIASVVSLVMSAGPWNSRDFAASNKIRVTSVLTRNPECSAFVGQRFYSRQLLTFQELKRRAAAGRDVGDFVGDSGGMHGGDRVSASYDPNGASVLSDSLGDVERSFSKWSYFEDAHRAVPDDGAGARNFFGKHFAGFRTNIQRHHSGGNGVAVADDLHAGVGIDFVGNDMVHWQQKLQLAAFCVVQDLAGKVEFVFLHQRLSYLLAHGF